MHISSGKFYFRGNKLIQFNSPLMNFRSPIATAIQQSVGGCCSCLVNIKMKKYSINANSNFPFGKTHQLFSTNSYMYYYIRLLNPFCAVVLFAALTISVCFL